jgi:hypothetical protein
MPFFLNHPSNAPNPHLGPVALAEAREDVDEVVDGLVVLALQEQALPLHHVLFWVGMLV